MFVKCKCFRPESFEQLVYIMMDLYMSTYRFYNRKLSL
jgi:hypothetical protein